MTHSPSKRIASAVVALGLAGGMFAVTAGSAMAATKHTTHTATGVVKSFDKKTNEMVLKIGKKSDRFKDTKTTKVVAAGKSGKVDTLKAGEKVSVSYTVSDKTWVADTISVEKA